MTQPNLFDYISSEPLTPEEKVDMKERRIMEGQRSRLIMIKENSEKLEEWQKKGQSIDIYNTYKEKHYWVYDLSHGSVKKVWAICIQCGKGRWLPYQAYHDLCISCVHSGENLSEETLKKMSESRSGENNPFFGRNHTKESREKMRESHIGVHHSEEYRIKMSCACQKIPLDKFDGFTHSKHQLFIGSKEWKECREFVFERDKWTCQECGATGVDIEAHHNVPYHLHPEPEYSLNPDSIITLCKECHDKTKGHEDEYYAKYNAIIKSNSGFKGDFLESSAILEAMTKQNDPMPQISLDYEFMPPEQIKEIERRKKIDDFANSILDKCNTYSSPNLRPLHQITIFDY